MARRRRSAPVSVLRSRLNQRLSESQKHKTKPVRTEKTAGAETEKGKKKFFFMSFSLGFLRSMNSYFYLKMAIALIIVLMLGIIQQTGWAWTGRIIEGARYIVTWDMDLQFVQDRVVPVFNNIDTEDILDKVSFVSRESETALPVSGELKSGFGLRENPQSGKEEMQYGINIAAEKGALIRAVLSGEVITSDEGDGVIMIRHDKEWVSVYQGVEEIRVAEGDKVAEGQVMGIMGAKQDENSAHLYFELRWDGRPQDPLEILGEFYQQPEVEVEKQRPE